MKKLLATSALALALFAVPASAVTVNTNNILPSPSGDVLAPTSTSGNVRLNFVGDDLRQPAPNSRSPWSGTQFVNDPEAKYNSVSARSSAIYDFHEDQSKFSLMWGSPDTYNKLEFFDNRSSVFSLLGNEIGATQLGKGFVNVTISDITFDRVVFTSGNKDAFEFANVSEVPIPLPITLFLSSLVGLGIISTRK